MKILEALSIISAIGLSLGGEHPTAPQITKVAPERLQRTPDQVEELKQAAQEKRDRKAAKLKALEEGK